MAVTLLVDLPPAGNPGWDSPFATTSAQAFAQAASTNANAAAQAFAAAAQRTHLPFRIDKGLFMLSTAAETP